jgi:hypothetical protein
VNIFFKNIRGNIMRKLTLIKSVLGILILFLLSLSFTLKSNAQCTYCTASTSIQDEGITEVIFGDIDVTSGWQGGVADNTSKSTNIKVGSQYSITVKNGLNTYGSSDYVSAFIDWNQNCSLTDSGEEFDLSTSDGGATYTGTITVPSNALGGTTRMRVRMVYSTTRTPCGSSTYGEVEDYSVNVILPAPDAGIASITPPTYPYVEGTYPVKMTLGSYGDGDLGSCIIHWAVNGVEQSPYYWSGTLKKNNTTTITLGNYDFIYPPGGPWNPFTIHVWLTDIVGSGTSLPDADPTNNDKSINTSPATEDAQPVSISQPSGSFMPGLQNIAVVIQNNARKPLTVVDIDWYVDGVKQGTKKWFGSLNQNQTAEVVVGSYNFTFKTPLAPFTIKAVTVNPNGVSDPVPANDQLTRDVAPSLVAGTYTVGGSNAHFPDLNSCFNYLNSSGILGNGDVHIKINSGTYNEQAQLVNFPHGSNNFYFESASGFASDVNINFAPDAVNNYIISINGLGNVTFQNLTFNASGSNGGGTIISGSNNTNINFLNIVFNGTNSADAVSLTNPNNLNITGCTFNGGNNGVMISYSGYTPNFTLKNNLFKNYSGVGFNTNGGSEGGKIQSQKESNNQVLSTYPIVIDNNEFSGNGPMGGIILTEAAQITNNKFVGLTATTSGYSAININATSSYPTLIKNNSITNLTGVTGITLVANNATIENNNISTYGYTGVAVNGMYLQGNNESVGYNKVIVSGISGLQNNGLSLNSANGIIANNLINVTHGRAFYSSYGNGIGAYYNTFVTTANTLPAVEFYYGKNIFQRNLVQNYGTSRSVLNTNSNITSANNNFYTKGATNGSDLTTYQNITGDNTSGNLAIELTDDGTYRYVTFVPEIVTYDALGLGNYETADYYGQKRDGFYYLGYTGIELTIDIIKQPVEILACNGSTGNSLQVAATISYGAEASYQWEKDGVPVVGATDPIYRFGTFDYTTTGTYRCKIYGPANTKDGIYSNEVLVYTLRNTEITKQPTDVTANLGGTAVFEVEVHIKGIVPPYFQHKYQWYRHYNGEEVQLMDNEYYANTTSPIMTITNLQDKHFSGIDDYYYVVVEGLCGTVTSNPVHLVLGQSEIVFNTQPANAEKCIGSSITLTADAQVAGSDATVHYQWYFNGTKLADDSRISGSTTNTLTIANINPTDEGNYYVAVSSDIASTVNSNTAVVTVDLPPSFTIQPTDVTLTEGDKLVLTALATGSGPIMYQWYKDDIAIDGATSPTYEVDGVTIAHTGFYYLAATNLCGTTHSTVAQVVVNKSGGVTGVTENNPINLRVTPNPAISDINVTFTLESNTKVEIALIDMSGKKVSETLSNANSGLNTITIKANNTIANGVYFVRVTYNGTSVTKQVVVTK